MVIVVVVVVEGDDNDALAVVRVFEAGDQGAASQGGETGLDADAALVP